MNMLGNALNKTRATFFLSILCGASVGCGVVYTPQEFKESSLTYGYKGGFDVPIEVVPMTFTSVRKANLDAYTPKSLPDAFSQIDQAATIETRDQLARLGLDQVEPPLVFDTPTPPTPYSQGQQVLQPGTRNESLQPLAIPPPASQPLPEFDFMGNPVRPYISASNARDTSFKSNADLDVLLERPSARQRPTGNPLPRTAAKPYIIGPGDVLGLQIAFVSDTGGEGGGQRNQRLLVQDDGQVFTTRLGSIAVGGLTLEEAQAAVSARLVSSGVGLDAELLVTDFGSKSVAVSGLNDAKLLPISVRPITLGDAIVEVGGLGANPEDMIVRVLREGTIYEMSGDQVLRSGDISKRLLMDGDVVSLTSGYDPGRTVAYFEQQMRLREIERAQYDDAITARREARANKQDRRSESQELRAIEAAKIQRVRFDIELRNYRLEIDRLRREAEIAELQAQRSTDRLNEEARIANIQARQTYLNNLRSLQQLNRAALRETRQEQREVMLANQTQRSRERNARRELLELELREERLRLGQVSQQREQARGLFNERVRLGAIERDYVTITGEVKQQTTVALPFDSSLTLTRVLYKEANGINVISANTSEIYVIRTPSLETGSIDERLTAYHLNASNPAALAVASMFEMRPNDVVYINPQPITKWNRVLSQILPSTGLLRSGISAASGLN